MKIILLNVYPNDILTFMRINRRKVYYLHRKEVRN
jgi:hypothetical protein